MSDSDFIENYCVLFFDALGYRDRFKGESVVPEFPDEAAHVAFQKKVTDTAGYIEALQKLCDELREQLLLAYQHSLATQHPDLRKPFQEAVKTTVEMEYWSDGFLCYTSIHERVAKCPCVGIFGLFTVAGVLCNHGLAEQRPLRGAAEIGWAKRTPKGSILGAAPVLAYELESQWAGEPRIVVGPILTHYLQQEAQRGPAGSLYDQLNSVMAHACLSLLRKDHDGISAIDYLDEPFSSTEGFHEISSASLDFIRSQINEHSQSGNGKLEKRYQHLLNYFRSRGLVKDAD